MFLLVPAYPGSPGQKAVKRLCVSVCVCVSAPSDVETAPPPRASDDDRLIGVLSADEHSRTSILAPSVHARALSTSTAQSSPPTALLPLMSTDRCKIDVD